MSERRSLDRLLLPKMRTEPVGVKLLVPESTAPLPRWQTLPLDAKFPVIPAAKDEMTFVTTKICQPAYRSTQHETFDLSDPYNRTIQTEYQALSDPYLKDFLAKPHIRKQLLEQNLVTPSGKVPCTVRDFNNYRNFLRRQALIKNKEPETLTRATENRNLILRKTKMKAELVSVEVKCKSLKAQQMLKEAEEEKQRQFWRKQALETEKEHKRLEEEKKAHDELVKKRKERWIEKQREIREKDEIARREHDQKVLQIELEAQEKLNKVDAMRQYKQQLMEARRRQRWHQKRQYQMQVLEEALMQQKRVEMEMEMGRRQYEDKMTNSSVKHQDAAGDTLGIDETVKSSHEDGFLTGQRKSQLVHQKYEPVMNLSRRSSMWILEELLYSSGMSEEVNVLFSTSSPQEYSRVLDQLIGSVMTTTRSATVLGAEQDALSKIIHLIVRQLEEAYFRKEEQQPSQETAAAAGVDSGCLKRLIMDLDVSPETERAHHVCMSATLDMDCKFAVDKSVGDNILGHLSEHEERARLFSNHLRLPESEIREMESDLTHRLMHFQKATRTPHEQKQVLEMFLSLACHVVSGEGDAEQNNGEPTLETAIVCPSSGFNDSLPGEVKMLDLLTNSGTLANNRFDKFQAGGEEDTKMIESELKDKKNIGGGGKRDRGGGGDSIVPLGVMAEAEMSPRSFKREPVVKTAEQVKAKFEPLIERTKDDVDEIGSGRETIEGNETVKSKNRQSKDINSSSSERDVDIQDHLSNSACLDVSKSMTNFGSNNCTGNTEQHVENDKTPVEPASLMHTRNASVCLEVEDFTREHQPAEPVAELTNSEDNLCSTDHGLLALSCETIKPTVFTRGKEQCSGMPLIGEVMHGNKNIDNELENVGNKEVPSTCKHQMSQRECSDAVNTELSFSKTVQPIRIQNVVDLVPDTTQRAAQEATRKEADEQGDDMSMAAQFVMKMQQRQFQGIGLPPAKIHYIITTFLSRLWRRGLGETVHLGSWLYNPDVTGTVRSLIYSVKTMRLPQELINVLTNAIVTVILHNQVDFQGCLPEGAIRTTIHGFTRQLEKEQVSVRILEDVLFRLQQEYDGYLKSCLSFQVDLFLIEALSIAEELLSKGKTTSNDFVKNILDYAQLPRQSQVTLIYSPWKTMLHQAKVAVQLSAIASKDRAHLEYLVLACGEKLAHVAFDNVQQCVEQLRSRMEDEVFKIRSAVTLSASVVAALLPTVEEKRISGLTLLPGALTLRSLLSPGALGQDNTGDAVVLLVLDSLARDMGEDTIDRQCLGHIAASLVDLLTRQYSYQSEALEGEGLAGGLDCMTSRFRCKSLEFMDSCRIMSAILRPYLGCLLKEERDACFKVDLGEPVCVDEDLLPSLFDFITEVFVTFVRGMIARMRRRWVGNDLHDDLLVLYVWRTMAILAKEANKLLCHKNTSNKSQKPSFRFARWNINVFVGLVDTFKVKHDEQNLCRSCEGSSTAHASEETCPQDKTETAHVFLACLSRLLPEPGYVPVPDLCMSNHAAGNDSAAVTLSKAMKGEAVPADVEQAARREIINSCQSIFESMVTTEALQKIKNKVADHVTCAVCVIHRLTTILSEKIWTLKERLGNNSLTVNDMIPFLVNCQDHIHPETLISKEFAFKILTLFILELEAIQQSVTVLGKMVQRLTRIDQHPTGAEDNASSILSAISSSVLTQFIRAFIVDILKMVAWIIDKIYHDTGIASMKTPLRVYTADVAKIAIAVVCDAVKFLKKVTRKEAKIDDGRGPRHAAGSSQDSLLQMPKEVYENVFGCIVDITETVGSTDDDTEIDTPSASDMVAFLINQILTSVTSCAGAGKCNFVCVNDLLLNDEPSKPHKKGEAMDAGGHKAASLEKREMRYLLSNLEQKESEYLLQRLIEIITCICNSIKQEVNDAVLKNEPCDSLLQAFAFMNVKLGKVQHDLAKRCITISNRQSNVSFNTDVGKPNDAHFGAGEFERAKKTFSNEAWKLDDGKMPVSEYIEHLFRNVTDLKTTNKGLNIYPTRVIKVILKACYSLDVSFLVPENAAMHTNDFMAQSAVLVEIMINELYNKLTELEKARTKEIDKETNYPYLFSRAYTTPDPWGPYYSDVAVRARQLTDCVRAGSATRSQVQRLSAVSSLISSKEESLVSESSHADVDLCSTAGEDGVMAADGVQGERQSRDRRRHTRAAAWRRKVQNCSSVHNKENSLRMWVRNDIEMSHKMPGLQKKSKMASTGKQCSRDALTIANNAEKLEKVNSEDSQTINGQSNQKECHKRSTSAQRVDQKSTKSCTPVVKTVPKKVIAGKNDDKSKQQITRINEKHQDSLKETKDGSSKTRVKIREAAAQKHVSRISGRSSVKSTAKSTEAGGSNAWPRTVHIIQHAYTEKSNTAESQMHGTNKAALVGIDKSLNQLAEEQVTESQTKLHSHGWKEEEHPRDQQQPASADVLLSLLGKELPRQVMTVRRCLGKEAVDALETVDLANVLCAVDLALGELDRGDELQAVCVLEGGCAQGKVSQRTVEAINNQLRSLTNNSISDEEIQKKLTDVGTDCQNVDIFRFRQQLTMSLSVMAERADQGHQVPEVFSGRQAEVLDALRYVKETSQNTEGVNQQDILEENVYESDGESSAAEGHSQGCKTSTNSLTPSCNTALTSVSVSDADSNDDKCIISSSWTILTSCPSLSSSRSSNIDHARHAEGKAENKQSHQQKLGSPKAEGILEPKKETQLSGKDSKTGITFNIEDGIQPSGRGSVLCINNENISRKDNEYNDNGECSERSSLANASMTSQERQLPDKATNVHINDRDNWSLSGRSSKTGSGHNYTSDLHHLDDIPAAERPYSQSENRHASELSSWSSSPKSSQCSSARSSRDEGASSPANSLSSISTTSVRPGKQKDGRESSRSSRSHVSVDQDEASLLDAADDDRMGRSSRARDRDSIIDLTLDDDIDDQRLSESHNNAGTASTEAPAQNHLYSDGYSTDHESCASEEEEDDEEE